MGENGQPTGDAPGVGAASNRPVRARRGSSPDARVRWAVATHSIPLLIGLVTSFGGRSPLGFLAVVVVPVAVLLVGPRVDEVRRHAREEIRWQVWLLALSLLLVGVGVTTLGDAGLFLVPVVFLGFELWWVTWSVLVTSTAARGGFRSYPFAGVGRRSPFVDAAAR